MVVSGFHLLRLGICDGWTCKSVLMARTGSFTVPSPAWTKVRLTLEVNLSTGASVGYLGPQVTVKK